jgi:hypothetical protein
MKTNQFLPRLESQIQFLPLSAQAVFSSLEKGEKCTVARFGFIWQIVSNH